jgi:hypothetical protein
MLAAVKKITIAISQRRGPDDRGRSTLQATVRIERTAKPPVEMR